MDSEPGHRFLTAKLQVEYLRPTPIDQVLEVRGRVARIEGRKVTVHSSLFAGAVECARGEVLAIEVPESYLEDMVSQAK